VSWQHQRHHLMTKYLTAFTVYLDEDLRARVNLNPILPEGIEVRRTATDFDFDVAALWIQRYQQQKRT
jgi:hypothetical protein